MKLRILQVFFAFIILLITACSNEKDVRDKLIFDKDNQVFNDLFALKKTYRINSSINPKVKLFGIDKMCKTPNDDFIIYDHSSKYLLLINKEGKLLKTISHEGKGPGEFSLLSDFICNNNGDLFALDFKLRKVLYFKNYEFVKDYRLSYVHRNPTQILEDLNNNFVIAAQRNLTDNSNHDNFQFLPYEEVNFLNIYDKEFNFKLSFLKPDHRLIETKGILTRTRLTSFSPSCVLEDKILTTTQEGFYNMYIHNTKGEFQKKYTVIQNDYNYIDLWKISELKLNKKTDKNSLETVGRIMASYSVPISIHNLNNILLVTIMEPYDNYFPMFSTNELNIYNFHLDIFKYKKNNIIPIFGGIPMDRKIIGVSDGKYIYCIKNEHIENIKEIQIEKYGLRYDKVQ